MPTMPVFDAGPMLSAWSVMRFPGDLAQASAMASWAAASKLNEGAAGAIGPALTATIANEAARFGPWLKEMRENEYAGSAVGEVVKVLLALLAENPETASWNYAIYTVKEVAVSARNKAARTHGKTQMAVSESSLRLYLKEFSPVLHLWGTWAMRGRRWLADLPAGYSYGDDFQMFLCESEAILEKLKSWDSKKKTPSEYLEANFFSKSPRIGDLQSASPAGR